MWLRSLAGAYAGQIRDFRTDVGLMALRSGMAERVDVPDATRRAPVTETPAVPVLAVKKRKLTRK